MKEDALVCSQCCGLTRKSENCQACEFYRENRPIRLYSDVPRFSTQEMNADFELQAHGNTIEGTLCSFDHAQQRTLKDATALKIIETLLDKYHFHDSDLSSDDILVHTGVNLVLTAMAEDLSDVPEEVIVKILGVIRHVARRRSRGRREYFDVIQQYVGLRIGPGMRVVPHY